MLASLIFVLAAAVHATDSLPIHKHMTKKEIRNTFQNGHDPVPRYEVVPVYHTLHRHNSSDNSIIAVRVNAFEREMSLYLEPNDGVLAHFSTPVWTVSNNRTKLGNVEYTRLQNPFTNIGRAYHDPSNGSAIVAYKGIDGETLILGNLNADLIIRPLPHRLHEIVAKESKDANNSTPNYVDTDFRETHHHVVFQRPEQDKDSVIKTVKRDKNHARSGKGRSKRSLPDVIYPEILVVVDFTLFDVLDKNLEETTRYVLALWNAVDLRYRLLSEPAIRLNIAGIIISLTNGGTAYLDNSRRGTTNLLDSDRALIAMSHYFYNESSRFNFSTYDMAIAMTHLDMCNVVLNDVCDTSTLGYAYEWGACNRSHVDANTEAVGIVEDNGGFKAIIAAAHEVAHLMGVSHDGLEEAESCPGFDGFLMSSFLHPGENSFTWSECSLRNLRDFLSSEEATCLFNKPSFGVPLPRILPGKILTLDQQCERISGTKACHHDERVCTRLECYTPGHGELCFVKTSAAEGSDCGDHRVCINGHCVKENVTFVPYSSSTTFTPPVYPNGHFFNRPRPTFFDD